MVSSTDDLTYIFGECAVRPLTRELRIKGQACAVQPKVFELLVHLLKHRARVVTKKELLLTLWNTEQLSNSVVSRTVMLVRQVIGDTADSPVWIQNIYGVGYRFVGEVNESVPGPTPSVHVGAPAAGGTLARRVGLWPLVNETNEPGMQWMQAGLMALVGHALERDARLGVMMLGNEWLGPQAATGASLGLPAAANKAREAHGLHHVVHTTLRKQGQMLWLDYQLFSQGKPLLMASLSEGDPLVLCQRLSQALGQAILSGAPDTSTLLSSDPLVNLNYARANEFTAKQNWSAALSLLGAACTLDPHNKLIELARVRCLVRLRDPSATSAAEHLLQRLDGNDPPLLHCSCHEAMATALMSTGTLDSRQAAEAHQALLLKYAALCDATDAVISIRTNAANLYSSLGQLTLARELFESCEAQCRETGNLLRLCSVQANLSVLDRQQGNLMRARQRLDEAVRIWRRGVFARPKSATHALILLAIVDLHMGLFDEARALCDEGVGLVLGEQLDTDACIFLADACFMYFMMGQRNEVESMVAIFKSRTDAWNPDPSTCDAVAACGSLMHGEVELARQHLWSLMDSNRISPGLNFKRKWATLQLLLELSHGDAVSIAQCDRDIESLQDEHSRPELTAARWTCDAARAHAEGRDPEALQQLLKVVHELPLGLVSSLARLDAAWLQLERDEIDSALSMVNSVPTWRDSHPAGLVVHARCMAAQGQMEQARKLQARAFEAFDGVPHAAHLEIARSYEAAPSAKPWRPAKAPQRLPRLLSATWLLGPPAPLKASGGSETASDRRGRAEDPQRAS